MGRGPGGRLRAPHGLGARDAHHLRPPHERRAAEIAVHCCSTVALYLLNRKRDRLARVDLARKLADAPKAPRKTAAAPAAKPGAKPKPVKGTITINDRRSETGKSQVEGFIHGAFAAHPNIAGLKSWTVTHVGTGLKAEDAKTKTMAIKAARILDKYKVSNATDFSKGTPDARAAIRVANALSRSRGGLRQMRVPARISSTGKSSPVRQSLAAKVENELRTGTGRFAPPTPSPVATPTPPTPSLRAQADAYRASKGTAADRAKALGAKITTKAASLNAEMDQAKKRFDRYSGNNVDKIRSLRDQFQTVIPAKAQPVQRAATKLRKIEEKVTPERFGYVRNSPERLALAKSIKQTRAAVPALKSKAASDYETFRTMSGNLTRRKDNGSVRNALRSSESATKLNSTQSSLKQARERAKRLTRMTNAARS